MKIRGKRLTALLLVMVLAVSLAACGKGSGSGKDGKDGKGGTQEAGAAMPEVTIKDGVVRATEVVVADSSIDMDGVQLLGMEDGWFYGFFYSDEGEAEQGYGLVRFKTDGSALEKIPCSGLDASAEIVASAFYDGCFYLGLASYQNSPALDYALANEGTTAETAIPEDLSEDATGVYQVCCVAADGKVKWTTQTNKDTSDAYYFINSLAVSEEGVFVSSSDSVDRFDRENGEFAENICKVSEADLTGALYVLQDGKVIMTDDFSSAMKISAYDPGQKKFVESATFPNALQGATLYAGTSYDYYLAGEDGIYGANVGSSELKSVINFVNSDLDAQGVVRFFETADGQYALQAYGSDTSVQVYLLDPVAPEDVKEKKELTLGGYYIDYEVRSEVIRFNKESDQYRISLVDYSKYDLDTDEYYDSTGLTKMNTDIASGNAPDIMLIGEQMPTDSYIAKGVFEDLTDRYNNDTEIDKSDFLKNVTDAFLTDGKMYMAVPGFTISGVSGKTKFIGDGKDLSIKKARQIAADRGLKEGAIFGVIDRDTVLQSAIEFSGDQFIDRETHSCDFNNEQFRQLLEFVKQFPEAVSEEEYNDYFTQYLGDRAILNIQVINTIYDYNYMTRDLFGDLNITLTGFPSESNKGPAVSPALGLAINSSTSDPDGCWSFVRRFYLPEYQMKMEGCLPVSEKAIDAQGQALIESLKEQREEYEAYMRELDQTAAPDAENAAAEQDQSAAGTDQAPAASEDKAGETADAPTPQDAVSLDSTQETAAEEMPPVEESEDLMNVPIPEEDFDGTHEEYEAYVAEFEKELAEAGGTFTAEVITEDEALAAGDGTAAASANLPDFNESDLQQFKEIVKGLNYAVNSDTDVWSIVSEEAEAYFADQKSVEEITDIIQSRVQVYLKENE